MGPGVRRGHHLAVDALAFSAENASSILVALVVAPAAIVLSIALLRGYVVRIEFSRGDKPWWQRHDEDGPKHKEES